MFLEGMCSTQKQTMAGEFQFTLATLLVKYLDVPLSLKCISTTDRYILVNKMTTTIRTWHAKYLIYS